MKVCVVGVGAVGGFVGGMLAKRAEDSEFEVLFLARDHWRETYRREGIRICSRSWGEFRVHPDGVYRWPEEIGKVDLLFLCVKSYELEEVCREVKCMVREDTAVVVFVDGLESTKKAARNLGRGIFLDAAFYAEIERLEDGSILEQGRICELIIGIRPLGKEARKRSLTEEQKTAMETVASLFRFTGIRCMAAHDMETALWRYYIFHCALHTVMAAYGIGVSDICKVPRHQMEMKAMLMELSHLARLNYIPVGQDNEEKLMKQLRRNLRPSFSSSLRRDLETGRPAEIDAFSGYALELSREFLAQIPVTERLHGLILQKLQ